MSGNDFEPVTSKSTRPGTKELRLHTGSPGGYLTAAAVREWFDDVEAVTLAVDREHSQLGIHPGADGPGDTFTLSKSDYDNANVAVKTAFRTLGVECDDLEQRWRFPLEEDGRYIVADVSQLVEAVTGAVHCNTCGQRFDSEQAKKGHYTSSHNDPKESLEETDPDAVGEPFPGGESV
jgi:hypothetical protein